MVSGIGGGWKWEMGSDCWRVQGFFGGGDKNVLKFESGAQPYSTKYTLKGWIVWYVNYISIKFLLFFLSWAIETK